MLSRRPLLLTFVAAIAGSGCGPSAEKVEAAHVLAAIDALRDSNAPADQRLALVDKLAAEPAEHKLAEAARDRCVEAYRPLLEATATMQDVQKKKEAGELGPEVFAALKSADQAVEAARESLPKCEAAQAALARAYR